MISAHNLKKVYRMGLVEVHALNGVSLDIRTGEFIGIMGSSGSGKSTLLHMLGLLDDPTEGEIMIGGQDVLEFSDSRKGRFRLNNFGFIFQDYALVPELTAIENVILPSIARGTALPDAYAAGCEYLDHVELYERRDHLPAELSGGEQQRVAIARALVNSPDVLFADEPCANLDSENSRVVLDLFRQINRDFSQTVIMVSHEDWHKEYFNRVIRLRDGKIEREETIRHDG